MKLSEWILDEVNYGNSSPHSISQQFAQLEAENAGLHETCQGMRTENIRMRNIINELPDGEMISVVWFKRHIWGVQE